MKGTGNRRANITGLNGDWRVGFEGVIIQYLNNRGSDNRCSTLIGRSRTLIC